MDALARRQQMVYEQVWQVPEYRKVCHGLNLWRNHRELFPETFRSALDLGCGLGYLVKELNEAGIDCRGVDIAHNAIHPDVWMEWGHKIHLQNLWDLNLYDWQFDVGICADVMEHIPEDRVPAVLERMAAYCELVVFKISAIASQVMNYDLHPTRKSAKWWMDKLVKTGGMIAQWDLPTARKEYFFTWRPEQK